MTTIETGTKLQAVPKLSAVVVKDKPKHLNHLAGSAIVGTVTCLFLYFYLTSNRFHYSSFGLDAIFSISIFFAFGALLVSYCGERIACRQNEYKRTLKSYDRSELIKLSRSPELSADEQELVVEFLNETHSGWSLAD